MHKPMPRTTPLNPPLRLPHGGTPKLKASPVDALLPFNDPYRAFSRSLRKLLPKPRSLWMPARNSSMSASAAEDRVRLFEKRKSLPRTPF